MQPATQSGASSPSAHFAGILAAIASPTHHDPEAAKAFAKGDLGDDVVTLSNERALSAHARYKPDRGGWQSRAAAFADAIPASPASQEPRDAFDRDLRTSSVTVRLSKAEGARLHQRAAEAGLTISAYLRSCTFEAEALRAQVKDALAGLRSAATLSGDAAATEGAAQVESHSREDVRLRRVLCRIGKFCLGISAGRS
ncbi:MAG TPA: hypothetical protein VMT38_05825 [Terracidiphilus sp.]|nr:hypothetical protein [Terracidiphilus sp.]